MHSIIRSDILIPMGGVPKTLTMNIIHGTRRYKLMDVDLLVLYLIRKMIVRRNTFARLFIYRLILSLDLSINHCSLFRSERVLSSLKHDKVFPIPIYIHLIGPDLNFYPFRCFTVTPVRRTKAFSSCR